MQRVTGWIAVLLTIALARLFVFQPARSEAADSDPYSGFGTNGVVTEPAANFGASSVFPNNGIDDPNGSLLVSGTLNYRLKFFIARYLYNGQ